MKSGDSIPVVVLDRDGTVIEDRHYIRLETDVVFYRGAADALKQIQAKGYPIFLVSNQSGVGRGWIRDDEFQKVHRRFVDGLAEAGVVFDSIAYCFHAPEENCPCRKPRAGLVPQVFQGKPIDWKRSFVVGDHLPDVGLAETLGATPCLVLTGKGPATRSGNLPKNTQVFDSLIEFASQLTLLVAVLLGGVALGAEVKRVGKDNKNIAISHDETRHWQAPDRVCILQQAKEIACGVVVKSAAKGAIVRLDRPSFDVLVGDKVTIKLPKLPDLRLESGDGAPLKR